MAALGTHQVDRGIAAAGAAVGDLVEASLLGLDARATGESLIVLGRLRAQVAADHVLGDPEFGRLRTPAHFPVRVLIQRCDDAGPAAAHIDVACSDVPAVRAWHEELGARFVAEGRCWTVMHDPAGGIYCLTPRSPETGLAP